MFTIDPNRPSTVSERIAALPQYTATNFLELPADAAPEGRFADGGVYYETYRMLTPSDIALVESITGKKSLEGDPLAAAIGTDRADVAIGWAGGLTGDVTAGYLRSIEAEVNSSPNGAYDGTKVSSGEIDAAIDYVNAHGNDSDTTKSVSVSA